MDKGLKEDEILEDLLAGKSSQNSLKFSSSKSNRRQADANFKNQFKKSKADLLRTASKMPQAILKISGYCKGAKHSQKHIEYISRYGKLELVLNDGSSLKGTTAIKELVDSWSDDFSKRLNSRDVLKIVLSAPENSDPNKLKLAAEKFLSNEFGDSNEYAFVLHTDTKKPHVHAIVKMVSYNGKKLDPRKNFLEKLRGDFAKFCREEGIMVEASRRYQRGYNNKSKNTPVKQMRSHKHENIEVDRKLHLAVKDHLQHTKKIDHTVPERNKIIRLEYIKAAIELHELSDKNNDKITKDKYKKASSILLDFAKNMPTERRFVAKVIDKISGKNETEKPLTFKAYSEVVAKLDFYKKSVISNIEKAHVQHQKTKQNNLELGLEIDI